MEENRPAGRGESRKEADMLTLHDDLRNGEGKVLPDRQIAISRDDLGTLHAVSSVCTHVGCEVEWNGDEKTWDCPCHGSRFSSTGEVLHGPAMRPLPPADIPG
jgi:Rieske Fe-S protein